MSIAQDQEHFYLSGRHFSAMLVAACLVHMIFIMIYLLIPKEKTEKIPVHVLNIKLGSGVLDGTVNGGGSGGRLQPRVISSMPYQPQVESQKSVVQPPVPRPTPAAEAPEQPERLPLPPSVPRTQAASPVPAPQPQEPASYQAQQPASAAPHALATPYTGTGRPSQYVRAGEGYGNGAGSGYGDGQGGSRYGNSTSPEAEVMHRYTQLISMWVNRHKHLFTRALQPGMKGNIIVRLQIDRAGNILYYKLDKGTGVPAADTAAGTMVRAANPVPPVPGNYPGGNLFEFLISVGYTAQ